MITEKDLTDLNNCVRSVYNGYHNMEDQIEAAKSLQDYANALVKKLTPKSVKKI